jgi:hypothetical protein
MRKLLLLPVLSLVFMAGCFSGNGVCTITQTVDHSVINTTTQTVILSNLPTILPVPPVSIANQANITTTATTTVVVSSPPTTITLAPVTVTNPTNVTTTATTTVTSPPVTVTTVVTAPSTPAPTTLANSIAFTVTPSLSTVTQIAMPQMIGYDVKYSNTSGTSFSSVNFVLTLTTNIPISALTNTNNITLTTLGYTWTLGVGSGINGIYTFTGASWSQYPS